MTINLRPMQLDDVEQICAIEQVVSGDPWSQKLFQDCIRVGYSCWVYADDVTGTVIGYGVLSCIMREAHVLNIAIKPEMQHKGYGKKMMLHLIQQARDLNADIVYLEVRVTNYRAITLYKQLSFVEIGQRKSYYSSGTGREDALVLALAF